MSVPMEIILSTFNTDTLLSKIQLLLLLLLSENAWHIIAFAHL
jgi:hypothetical protein